MNTLLSKVLEFHQTFNCYSRENPAVDLPTEQVTVRVRLMQEELDEYAQAANAHDLVGVADALSDLLYVLLGTYIAHGMQDAAEELFDEVHRSNMTKLDENGLPILREDGKILKSKLYSEPNLGPILEKYSK